jgi:hypothetical protein
MTFDNDGANEIRGIAAAINSRLAAESRSSGCFRLERLPGGTYTHWKAPPYHGAHPEQSSPDYSALIPAALTSPAFVTTSGLGREPAQDIIFHGDMGVPSALNNNIRRWTRPTILTLQR